MPTIPYTEIKTSRERSVLLIRWPGMGAGDDGEPFRFAAHYNDKSAQVTGLFGTAEVTIQGALDAEDAPSPTFAALRDPGLNPLTFASAGLRQILEGCTILRPLVVGGAGVSLTVTLLLVRK